MKKIIILAPYPYEEAPSQRFRFEQYLSYFEKNNWTWKLESFWNMQTWRILYKPGFNFQKTIGLLSGFLRRFFLLFKLSGVDIVFIHREAAPVGPPLFEWIIAKVLRKKIIYDFDDAIWKPNVSVTNSFANRVKWYGKVKRICKWATTVSCGNKYLCDYAKQFNSDVRLIPTTIDTDYHLPNKKSINKIPVIGWTGTHSTTYYLNLLIPVFKKLEEQFDFELRIISNKDLKLPLKSYHFINWNKETEISDLQAFDIGIMPLPDDDWSKGKCGFKLLQYIAVGVPSIASPVGVNNDIIIDNKTGWIAKTENDWLEKLSFLLKNSEERKSVVEKATEHLEKNYSVKATQSKYLAMLDEVVKKN